MESIKNVIAMLQQKVQKMETQLHDISKENAVLKKEKEDLAKKVHSTSTAITAPTQSTAPTEQEQLKFNTNEIIYHLKHTPNFKPPYISIDIQKELEEILAEENSP